MGRRAYFVRGERFPWPRHIDKIAPLPYLGLMTARQRLVIIGGSSGIGLSIAKLMAKAGYELIIASRSKAKLEKAKEEIGRAELHVLDVTDEDKVVRFFSQLAPFDHLVISAADFFMESFLNGKTKNARNYFDSKFWGQYCAAKYASPKLRKDGSITFFSGAANQKPLVNFAAGTAINAAIEGLCRALALELSPIRVNTISPGVIVTPLWESISKEDSAALFANVAQTLPAKRVGQPETIAEAARFLIECNYATGTVIHVDGGYPLV
jgi:NAD(P)-dependent dehydrogenase (short-subunit alcohol dehydrogenase family)